MTIEELTAYGLESMTDEEVESYLSNHSIGVLGLQDDGPPYVIPLSYAFDGDDRLYFTYLQGERSRKRELSEERPKASFLVYSVETMFNWRSVTIEGTLSAVPQHQWGDLAETLSGVWRPELFSTASTQDAVAVYRLDIGGWSGIKHVGLSPGFGEPTDETA